MKINNRKNPNIFSLVIVCSFSVSPIGFKLKYMYKIINVNVVIRNISLGIRNTYPILGIIITTSPTIARAHFLGKIYGYFFEVTER